MANGPAARIFLCMADMCRLARMAKLGRVIVEAVVLEYGRDEVLRRLAHPFWFQSFGAVMGMDWHSSGITSRITSFWR